MAAVKGRDIDKKTDSDIGRQLWLNLHDDDDVGVQYNGRATAFRTSYYEIIKEMGLTLSARSYATLLSSLDRLDGVSFKAETSSSIYPSQRLLTYQVDKTNRNIAIVLNSRICQALSGHYVRIELAERHQLESDTSKVCHAWLCAWCGTGSSKSIGIDKLLTKIWGSDASSASTTRSRRQILRAGIKQIDKLPGWTIREDDRGIIRIKRDAILDAS
jgi:protoporphyrinogen oxidase